MPLVPCRIANIVVDEGNDHQSVVLAELDGAHRRVSIAIGPSEALAIDRAVKGQQFPRPLTHDLLAVVITATHHRLIEVRIVDLREKTFFAELVLLGPDEVRREIDCRPSDALALLVRSPGVTLLVAEVVLAEAAEG
jgi:bifunctional DNase/RNase